MRVISVFLVILSIMVYGCDSKDSSSENNLSNNSNNTINNDNTILNNQTNNETNNTVNNQNDAGTDGFTDEIDFDGCVSVTEEATLGRGPADVIFVIDNTPSMENEINEVRENMNQFSQMVFDEGLDLHVVLISCLNDDCGSHADWHGICIDAPLGAEGGCPDGGPYADTNEPIYFHVSEPIPSTQGLSKVVSTYDRWSHMIRDNSAKHIVVVSDDNDDWTAQQFIDELTALDSRFVGFQAHGIYSFMSKDAACEISDSEPCCTYASPDGEGTVYRDLVELTGGLSGDMCLQDFDPVFNQLGGAVIDSAVMSCDWEIPAPPEGEDLDPDLVNVEYTSSSTESVFIGRVNTADDCADVSQGWYYDDNNDPQNIHLCPSSCTWVQGDTGAAINIHFGCEQIIAIVE
ncbi:MAG: hypothetical protein JXR95_15020 [Deltaproteobacteria bacterium]|nr:hypothetical protein [Deltaproteobacteria bacterium]